MADALADVNVVEFGGYAAGPCIGKYLANFGARVVHVESKQQPDGFRLQYPPFKDRKPGINRSACFAFFNDSKAGVTLNLKHPRAMSVADRLIEWADVVIENMRPGVMARLGLSYEELRRRNPSLVMISTTNMGQTGPCARHPGFGSQLSSLSGFTHFIGRAAGPPNFLYGPYIDFVAVAFGGIAVLAALDHQRRTGESVYIDLSQYETGLQFMSLALLDFAANGHHVARDGNRDPAAAPHGCYRCRDERWCVISCHDEDEWRQFCAVSESKWLSDARFRSFEARKQHETFLNEEIANWTRTRDAAVLMYALQQAGVHAAVVHTMQDLFADPQLAFRHIWQAQEHNEIGRHHYRMVSYGLSETPGRTRRPAPCLGQDNEQVCLSWLGIPPDEYQQLVQDGVFS